MILRSGCFNKTKNKYHAVVVFLEENDSKYQPFYIALVYLSENHCKYKLINKSPNKLYFLLRVYHWPSI